MYAFIPLSKVDKISQQLHRQPHPNHWSWHQNTRLSGPPGPPPPTRPILSSSSPSQGPQILSQQVRKYGSSQTNTRSPTSSLVQNPGFPATQVSRCYTEELEVLVEDHVDLQTALKHLFWKSCLIFFIQSLKDLINSSSFASKSVHLTAGATQMPLQQVGKREWAVCWFSYLTVESNNLPLFCFLQRETTLLRRSEGSGSFPSITISIPKPSFTASAGPAVADRINTIQSKTGQFYCSHCDTHKGSSYINFKR